ncbi:MAG: pyridoxal-phosphate dependent enzyme [Leptolyngbya sp. SIO1D8]|nr:pyridoxal-phosphate dependent enzyme [Leptolyngbya sp. SIO1D8]
MGKLELAQAAIADAFNDFDPVFLNSPQFELESLNDALNTRMFLKVETLNLIRSFKGCGTDYFAKQHIHESAFICASAGNFGQGMTYACRKQNIPLNVFAAETANSFKLDRMRQLEAEIQLAGTDFDAAKETAKAYAAAKNFSYVEDGREIEVTLGAGTIGLELSLFQNRLILC